ncbi:MAG: hypothetical protein ACIAXF_17055 [Phycisphaerales bacterium JB063]
MTDPTDAELWTIWQDASRVASVDTAMRALYEDVGQAIRNAPRDLPHGPPTCNASGRCCKFETYGHRLYVTGLEIAWFLQHVPGAGDGATDVSKERPGGSPSHALPVMQPAARLADACRYQLDGLCSTHTIRPLGCRVYFCTPGTDDWQHAIYERFLDRLRALHQTHGLPYRYMEWRAGLVEGERWLAESG